jgi:phosphonate transport system substrate-binding protein
MPVINSDRRLTLKHLLASACLPMLSTRAISADKTFIKIGTTPVFLDQQLALLDDWRRHLESVLQARVSFVQRSNYREILELLLSRQLDCAWLCGYPYVRFKTSLQLVAVPVFSGAPLYESYLITSNDDKTTRSITDLTGKVFAFSDPLSNSGYLFPRHQLWSQNKSPDQFFARTFFTSSHRKVVEAVAVGLAHAGSVDGYVWESLAKVAPDLTAKTRVVAKSPRFGFPPLVAPRESPHERVALIREGVLRMSGTGEGQRILSRLNLDGFVAGDEKLYDSIAQMMIDLQRVNLLA